jgi:hypothetical protein
MRFVSLVSAAALCACTPQLPGPSRQDTVPDYFGSYGHNYLRDLNSLPTVPVDPGAWLDTNDAIAEADEWAAMLRRYGEPPLLSTAQQPPPFTAYRISLRIPAAHLPPDDITFRGAIVRADGDGHSAHLRMLDSTYGYSMERLHVESARRTISNQEWDRIVDCWESQAGLSSMRNHYGEQYSQTFGVETERLLIEVVRRRKYQAQAIFLHNPASPEQHVAVRACAVLMLTMAAVRIRGWTE